MKVNKLNQYVQDQGYGGLSQLAEKLGISKETLRLIVNGKVKNPSVYTMAKIAEVLDCSIEELIGKATKLSGSSQLHSFNANYNKKLFLDVCNYVTKFISEKFNDNSSDIKFEAVIDAIDAVYDFSYKNSQTLGIKFAEWYCQQKSFI